MSAEHYAKVWDASGKLLLSGEWREGRGEPMASNDPSGKNQLWQGHSASLEDVRDAYRSANKAWLKWRSMDVDDRIAILQRGVDLIDQRKELMAECIHKEMGKPLWEARQEVGGVLGKLSVTIQSWRHKCGEDPEPDEQTVWTRTRHHPLGVMVVLGPFNLPAHLPNGHILPALLAGNVVMFKPSEKTPMVGEFLVQCYEDAGCPHGVLQLLQGGREVAQDMIDMPIQGVAFTGSRTAGVAIHQRLAGRPEVMLALEMGGNNPLVVWDADNLDLMARCVLTSSFITSGQRCVCARRLILPKGKMGDDMLNRVLGAIGDISIGEGHEDFMGPLVDVGSAQKWLEYQDRCIRKGAVALIKGAALKDHPALVSPSVLSWNSEVHLSDEECFGPSLIVQRAEDFDHACSMANDTAYGLSAGLISSNSRKWEQFQQEVHAGILNWNRPLTGASASAPFGGWGWSGNHRPSAWSAVDFCSQAQASTMAVELPSGVNLPGLPRLE